MKKKNNKKGFTLAELLIVVAIIAVLVAIAIPIFTTQLERSREATDISNVRAAYAEAMADYLAKNTTHTSAAAGARQQQDDWQGESGTLVARVNGTERTITYSALTVGSSYYVHVSASGTSDTSVFVSKGA